MIPIPAEQALESPDGWARYDDETYHRQPHWQNEHTGQVVCISYSPNIGGYTDDREWAAVLRENRFIGSAATRLDACETREEALETAYNWMTQHPRGDA